MKPALILAAALLAAPAFAGDTSPQALLDAYSAEAGATPVPENGKALFLATPGTGKPDTPSCTTCHTADPSAIGQARTGKPIEPLAPSANPLRFTDTAFVEKWFTRNCSSVLGRECTAGEKADVIAWLMTL